MGDIKDLKTARCKEALCIAERFAAADEIERLREALDDIGNHEIIGHECCEEFDYKYFYDLFVKTAQDALNADD